MTALKTTFTGDTKQLERAILKTQTDIDRLGERISKSNRANAGKVRELQKEIRGIGTASQGVGNIVSRLAPTFAAAFSVREVVRLADSFTQFQAKLINAKVASGDMAAVQKELFATAKANGQEVVSLADLYGNMAMSAKSLGLSQSEMMLATQGVAAAMRLSGSTTAQSSATILQLGQALAGGTVRAEEYNSMLENAPALVRAVADSSTRWAGDLGKLRKEINEGKISSQAWAEAIVAASAKLQSDAANAPLTVAASIQNLQTALVEYIGEADQSLGASEKLGFALKMLGENIDLVADSLMVVAAFLAARGVGAMANYTAAVVANSVASARLIAFQTGMTASMTGVTSASLMASAAMTRLSGAMAFFGGPIGLTITALAAAVMGLGTVAENTTRMNEEFAASMKASNEALQRAREITGSAASATKAMGQNSAGAVSGVNGLASATSGLATETYRLADANAAAAQSAIYKQIAENRRGIAERRNPSNWRQFGEAMGMRYNGGEHAGQYARDVRLREAEALENQNVALNIEAMRLGVLNPEARYVKDNGRASSTSGGGSAGGGRNSASASDIAANDEQVLAAARRRQIDALNQLADTSDERHSNALFMIDLEALELEKAIRKQRADGQISQAAADEALTINENTRLEERRAEEKRRGLEVEQERADAAREALEMDQAVSRLQQDTLRNRAAIADTLSQRAELESAEFALYQQAAKSDFEARQAETRARLKLADQLTAEAEARLRNEATAFDAMQKSEKDRHEYDQRQDNPFAKFVDRARDMNTSLKNVAADGLQSLEDGLVDVMMRTQDMGDMFKNVSKQVIADPMRIAVQKNITGPLANLLGFGEKSDGGNILSAIGKAFGFKRAAIGTNRSPGGLTLVGEAGPELLNIPKNGQIIPHNRLKLNHQAAARASAPVFHISTVVNADNALLRSDLDRQISQSHFQAVQLARQMASQDQKNGSRNRLR